MILATGVLAPNKAADNKASKMPIGMQPSNHISPRTATRNVEPRCDTLPFTKRRSRDAGEAGFRDRSEIEPRKRMLPSIYLAIPPAPALFAQLLVGLINGAF